MWWNVDGCFCPPEGKTLECVLEYLLEGKKTTSEVPADVLKAGGFPEKLLPEETVCGECYTPLGEPERITAKA